CCLGGTEPASRAGIVPEGDVIWDRDLQWHGPPESRKNVSGRSTDSDSFSGPAAPPAGGSTGGTGCVARRSRGLFTCQHASCSMAMDESNALMHIQLDRGRKFRTKRSTIRVYCLCAGSVLYSCTDPSLHPDCAHHMSIRRLLPVVLLLFHASTVAGQTPDRAALSTRIDSIVQAALRTGPPGTSVAVVQVTDTIVLKGYGLADVGNDVRVHDRSVFRIGSVTKQFTAAAIMRLVEQGRIRLDAPLAEYIPEYVGPGARVTIPQLLNHTAGIPSYPGLGPRFWDRSRLDLSHEQMLELFMTDSL